MLSSEISKNIQLVFDNQESFIKRFTKKSDRAESVHCFYMGGKRHFVRFDCEQCWTQPESIMEDTIKNDDFDTWKGSLKNN